MQEYHNRIRELREEKHITQVRLSTELGVAQETISAYEQGRHLPSVSSLMKLSSILDASMDYIMMKSDVRNMIQVQSLSDNETRLLGYYKKLNASGKEKALSYIEGLNDGLIISLNTLSPRTQSCPRAYYFYSNILFFKISCVFCCS